MRMTGNSTSSAAEGADSRPPPPSPPPPGTPHCCGFDVSCLFEVAACAENGGRLWCVFVAKRCQYVLACVTICYARVFVYVCLSVPSLHVFCLCQCVSVVLARAVFWPVEQGQWPAAVNVACLLYTSPSPRDDY